MVTYTQEEKNKLTTRFEKQAAERKQSLEEELQKLTKTFINKIERRSQRIPKKFMDLKIKDVLDVERDHKLKLYSLLKDISLMKRQYQGGMIDKETQLEISKQVKKQEKESRMEKLKKKRNSRVNK
ncbi:hypothetical protein BN7_1253 [Wickerhamomyces ciferrii]|uniref:Borealin N-terminal domain-containing protein n=1 Tax=Wickerhamomyces ciferrii (strain ATCC 14091 / BCRC 22168 / CBS 111 / JCM 3599 / NBRC 0793 / NRRL Y-1031 F-60-10) TaxID=1206466 RepID=K0KHR8_WICCF|nr:uncharacterized protein BN7_1253 [Wickerhamomyces ciferrii]CCH41712.1 hypothetical protein BN7_1253 [Wickerhamomyces ciferrii]